MRGYPEFPSKLDFPLTQCFKELNRQRSISFTDLIPLIVSPCLTKRHYRTPVLQYRFRPIQLRLYKVIGGNCEMLKDKKGMEVHERCYRSGFQAQRSIQVANG